MKRNLKRGLSSWICIIAVVFSSVIPITAFADSTAKGDGAFKFDPVGAVSYDPETGVTVWRDASGSTVVSGATALGEEKNPIKKSAKWAVSDIIWAQNAGIIDKNLDYTANITREEFAGEALAFLLYQADTRWADNREILEWYLSRHPEIEKKSFKDTEADSYANLAYTLGIVSGKGGGIFAPAQPITREEASVMLYKTYCFYGELTKEYLEAHKASQMVAAYTDASGIQQWAAQGVRAMTCLNVMNGKDDGGFHPKDFYTKEQSCATWKRLYENAPVSRAKGNFSALLTAAEYQAFLEEVKSVRGTAQA